GDCDDNDPEVYPGFPETCDQKDNDCDGQVDEGFDRDGDGFPGWYSGCGNDCDDADPLTYPGAPEVCDGKDNDCDGETDEGVETAFYRDEDGDGLGGTGTILACSLPSGASAGTGDCDDRDPARSPGTTEICDGKDNDCDGQVDEDLPLVTFYRDADGGGFGGAETVQACSAPAGYVDVPGDCDDADPGIHPGAEEVCDGKDNNCDGEIDEFLLSTFFRDADGDGFGGAETVRACSAPAGYVDVPGDCDDASAAVSPAVTEVCDGLDNDCDGLIDEDLALLTLYRDADADGFGGTMALETCSATLPGYIADSTDCDDTDLFTHPGATEICDGKDNNCDGQVDEGLLLTFYQDADGDGYGGTVTTTACTAPQGHVANSRDCNDADAGVHPGATEIPCDGIDQNCNGAADDGLTDADRDGWTECAGDCNDSNPNINPGVVETGTTLCDGIDQDCDGKDDCSARFVASGGAVLDTETGLSWLSNGMCLGPGRYVRGGTWDTVPSLTERVSLLGDGQCGLSDGSGPGNWRVSTIGEIQNLFRHGYCLDEQLGDQFYYGTPDTLCLGNAAGTYRWKPGDAFADLLYLGKYLTEPGKHWYYYYTSESAGAGYQSGVILYNTTMCRISGSSQECRIYVTFAYASTFGTTWDGGFVWPVRDKLVDNDGDGYYRGLDCDDTDPAIHPGATEVCDGIDNNCDGRIDEVCDSDGDGYTPEGGDCNDNDATIHPGATEVCDGKDNDCDGQVDEGVTQTFYRDGDGDGYGGTATILACIAPAGYVANSGDCNDNDAGVNPAAPDPCDGRDTNCDGREENRHVYFRDQDGDGFGALPATLACSAPTGYVDDRKDCDDTNPAINPLGTEVCDGKDNDCDGQVDEGLRQTFYWD
ncbi:MAG TPA: putative metal-binding motif-containing protein, partial [Methanomicrobiales archaeon]|nr:putative metal-binding motif-containing protein [Methanomicrobiales archaeon]